jgi:hypothetical protein
MAQATATLQERISWLDRKLTPTQIESASLGGEVKTGSRL